MTAASDFILEENARWDRVKRVFGAHAGDIARLWRQGDGMGGSILDAIAIEVQKAGYHCESPRQFYERRQTDPKSRVNHKILARLKKLVYERDSYRCVRCTGFIDLTIDHIHPISKGGATEFCNLQTLCRGCNSSKGSTSQGVAA